MDLHLKLQLLKISSCLFECSCASLSDSYFNSHQFKIPFCLAIAALFQSLSHVQLFVTPWTAARQVSLSYTTSFSLVKLMSIESMMPSNHLFFYCPLLLLPSIFPIQNESALHTRWPKYWSFTFSISPSNEYLWLISFRIDWLVLLSVTKRLKNLL